MKTLAGYTLLYDAECPMCALYTRAFVKTGMLTTQSRVAYQEMPEEACVLVDRQRAINEIALVNTQTGEVQYGIRSLFMVIGNAMPVFKPLFGANWFVWLMSKVYAFISYNRKVIVPAKAHPGSLQPTFRLGYRLLYILFASLMAGLAVNLYAPLVKDFVPMGAAWREYAVCFGQVAFQGVMISLLAPAKRWEYLGNMCTVSLAGGIALLPVIALAHWVSLPLWFCVGYFGLTAFCMLLEHMRRCKLIGLNLIPSASWVLYRLLVLVIIATL